MFCFIRHLYWNCLDKDQMFKMSVITINGEPWAVPHLIGKLELQFPGNSSWSCVTCVSIQPNSNKLWLSEDIMCRATIDHPFYINEDRLSISFSSVTQCAYYMLCLIKYFETVLYSIFSLSYEASRLIPVCTVLTTGLQRCCLTRTDRSSIHSSVKADYVFKQK